MKIIRKTEPKSAVLIISYAVCCQVWIIDLLSPLNRCGKCHTVPMVTR